MTKEEIDPIAHTITYTNNRTIITLKNGSELVGYFQSNADKNLIEKNKWNFVVTPQADPKKETLLNGDDFLKIEIVRL